MYAPGGAHGVVHQAIEVGDLTGLIGDDEDFSPELDPDYDYDSEDDLDGPALPSYVTRQVSRGVQALREGGRLVDTDWQLGGQVPAGQAYARVSLTDDDDDDVLDGFQTDAFVPLDATGQPAGRDVYVVRRGGIAGWQYTAGPFALPQADEVELSLEDRDQPLTLPPGGRLVVRLPYREGEGERWRPAPGALDPSETAWAAAEHEWVAAYELGDLDEGRYTVALTQGDGEAGTTAFYVPLTIEASRDELIDGDETW